MAGAAGPAVRWRRADDALVRRTDRSVIVLPSGAADPIVLTGAAVTVWDALTDPLDTTAVVAAVGARFGADHDLDRDRDAMIVATCDALRRCGAVVTSP